MTNRPLTSTPIALMRALQRTHAQWPLQSADCGTGLQRQRFFLLANGQTALENWAYTATRGAKSRRHPTTPCRMDSSSSSRSLQADGGTRWGYVKQITTLQKKKKLVLSDWNWRKKEILKLNHRQNKQIKLTLLEIKLTLIQSQEKHKVHHAW